MLLCWFWELINMTWPGCHYKNKNFVEMLNLWRDISCYIAGAANRYFADYK